MRLVMLIMVSSAVLLSSSLVELGEVGSSERAPQSRTSGTSASHGVVTLYSHDDILCAYSFRRNDFGFILQQGLPVNMATDLMFNRYAENALAIAIEGGSAGAIVDLGVAETAERQSIIWHLTRKGDEIEPSGAVAASQHRADFAAVTLKPVATAVARLGHTYVMKWTTKGSQAPYYAAVKVVDLELGRHVTLRWRMIE